MANLAYINSILDEEGIGVKPPTPKPSQNSVPTNMSQEELNSMVDEADADYDFSQSAKDVVSGIKEFAFDSADLAAAMLGGSGISEAIGIGIENPVSVATRGEEAVPIKSLSQDMKEGNYLDASLKTVGLAGDALQLGGAYTAATGAGLIPGAVMMAGGTALKFGATAVSKYGDEISDGLRKLFDIDPDAADKAAEVMDKLADQDKPIAVAQGVLNKQLKIAGRKERARSDVGGNNPPEATKPELVSVDVDNLGLFSRTEQAVKNMDIPEEGISGKALMARLAKDSKVPNDELDHGLGLMIDPNATITRADLDKMMSKNFGVLEVPRKLSKGETQYHDYIEHRLPDEPGSDYTEITYHLTPDTRTPVVVNRDKSITTAGEDIKLAIGRGVFAEGEHFPRDSTNQLFHMRTSIRTNKDGKRVLLIEEIQSDAFKPDGGAEDAVVPFAKNSGYTNLALARAMRIAADNDLDGIAITDGMFQIKRNKMGGENIADGATSKRMPLNDFDDDFNDTDIIDMVDESGETPSLSELSVGRAHVVTLESYEGGIDVGVDSETGVIFFSELSELKGKKLSDVLGSNDMADQLLAAGNTPVSLSFSERIITDSGYKAVYDKRIPKRLNTIIKTMDLKDSPNVTKSDITVSGENRVGSLSEISDAINNSEPLSGFGVHEPNSPLIKTYQQLKQFESELDGDNIPQYGAAAGSAFFQQMIETARFFDETIDDILSGSFTESELLEEIADRFPSSGITSTDELPDLDLDDILDITARRLREIGGGNVLGEVNILNIKIGLMDKDSLAKAVDEWLSNARENLDAVLGDMAENAPKSIDVPNNNTIIFTPEMRDQIKAKGLPRLRKGGLVSKRT